MPATAMSRRFHQHVRIFPADGPRERFHHAEGVFVHRISVDPNGRRMPGPNTLPEVVPMLRWKVLAVAGVTFGMAGLGWGYAQQQAFPGFYELRIYKAQPGKRDALAARFANRTAAIYARHEITNVGYFIPQQSDPELGIDAADTFIYIRAYPSKEERDKRLK